MFSGRMNVGQSQIPMTVISVVGEFAKLHGRISPHTGQPSFIECYTEEAGSISRLQGIDADRDRTTGVEPQNLSRTLKHIKVTINHPSIFPSFHVING